MNDTIVPADQAVSEYGYRFEDLSVGMTASYARTVAEGDISLFAGVSGDDNPVHINDEFARHTLFGGRIAHGVLTASYISTVLGTALPGPGCIYVEQNLRFKAPVRIGDTVRATVTVTGLIAEKRFVQLNTVCTVKGKVVIDGAATVMVPDRPR
ncbi:MAG: MaoC family dehydratase [Proteobacteria bacterium]|nr:MaoC family dehydratase [Pseudomonadota bacterium]